MNRPIRIVQYGLGPIGKACVQALLEKSRTGLVEIVGAIDIHPELAGRDLGEVLGETAAGGVVVSNDARETLRRVRPHVVIHTTSSFLERVYDQIAQCLDAGASVVSSTEELFYPLERHPDLAQALDELARERGVAVLGTGVNPGFAMDILALTASGICASIRQIRISRVVDASRRREPLQRKIGAGISVREFEERRASGTFGHIGLQESASFVARGLGWTIDRFEESLDPVVATERTETDYLTIEEGQVAGIHQNLVCFRDSHPILELDLQMFTGAPDAHDAVYIDGDPPVDLIIRGGIFGDTATVAALINAIPIVVEAAPGLRLALDLPVPRAFATAGGPTPAF
ncbi:MAG TPA: dihydrodipicolinate reductase [Rhodothermales bacterium]